MSDKTTIKFKLSVTVDELRDALTVLEDAEGKRGKRYRPDELIKIEQILRPGRSATTLRLPDRTEYVKVGGQASSKV